MFSSMLVHSLHTTTIGEITFSLKWYVVKCFSVLHHVNCIDKIGFDNKMI